jgi:hypothetical protein
MARYHYRLLDTQPLQILFHDCDHCHISADAIPACIRGEMASNHFGCIGNFRNSGRLNCSGTVLPSVEATCCWNPKVITPIVYGISNSPYSYSTQELIDSMIMFTISESFIIFDE